ncbi:hypothetical protein AWC38_SpisGene3892 [Stylophora pistillata]|uniref:Core-binding (CB) domain-containing protein n=1 Tax=Stylophora pistillata TaxID=50429 RepID=A0A2B4SQW4_STYPI|nr:hypothetical protein AWC38_SpisGene3892 [Stylophora pistillata]
MWATKPAQLSLLIQELISSPRGRALNPLKEIAEELDIREKTGSSIDEELSKIVQSLIKDKLQAEKTQAKVNKYPRPANVEGLGAPRFNPLIWNQVSAQMRTPDSKYQKTQAVTSSCNYMVPFSTSTALQPTLDIQTIRDSPPTQFRDITPTAQETPPNGLSAIRKSFQNFQFSEEVTEILMSSWREGVKKQYSTYLNQWLEFCQKRKVDHCSPKINEAMEFLMTLYNKGLSYSGINTARSALSAVLNIDNCDNFGAHRTTTRFMKGIYENRKPQPRYTAI